MKTIEVEVTERNIKNGDNGAASCLSPPASVKKFVHAFDDDRPVKPFKFTLKIKEDK